LHLANYLAPILSAKTIPRKAAQCLVDLKSVHCVANRDKVEKNGHLLGKVVFRSMSHIKGFVAFNLLRWSLNSADIFDLGRGPRIPDLQFRVRFCGFRLGKRATSRHTEYVVVPISCSEKARA